MRAQLVSLFSSCLGIHYSEFLLLQHSCCTKHEEEEEEAEREREMRGTISHVLSLTARSSLLKAAALQEALRPNILIATEQKYDTHPWPSAGEPANPNKLQELASAFKGWGIYECKVEGHWRKHEIWDVM